MNKYKMFKILILLLGIGFLWGCEDEVESPDVCYKLITSKDGIIGEMSKPYTVPTGREIQFDNCGDADFYAFFSGEDGNNYYDFISPDDSTTLGQSTSDTGDKTISYAAPGTYKAVMLLTNRLPKDPKKMKEATIEWEITVTEEEE